MSTPYENEFGSWEDEFLVADIECYTPLFKSNHQKDLDHILKFKGVQKDDAYKKIAIANIKTHPLKYFKNIIASLSSLLFGLPITHTAQTPLLKIWYFSIIYALIIFCSVPTILDWRKISFNIKFLLIFIYIAGSSLVSVGNRQFVIIVPVLLFWMVYIINKSTKIKIDFDRSDKTLPNP